MGAMAVAEAPPRRGADGGFFGAFGSPDQGAAAGEVAAGWASSDYEVLESLGRF
jgi:hypothetical protein